MTIRHHHIKHSLRAGKGQAPQVEAQAAMKADASHIHDLKRQRDALEHQIRELGDQQAKLVRQRRKIDRQIGRTRYDETMDAFFGPVVDEEALEAQLDAEAQPSESLQGHTATQDAQKAAASSAPAVTPSQPQSASEAPTKAPAAKVRASRLQGPRPTAAETEAAGAGILTSKGLHLPSYVEVLGHNLSRSTAIYAVLCLVAAVFLIPLFASAAVVAFTDLSSGDHANLMLTVSIFVAESVCILALAALLAILAFRMWEGETRFRLQLCEASLAVLTGAILCHVMVFGMTSFLVIFALDAALLISLHSYWDPELALERANRRTESESLRAMIFSSDERTNTPGKRPGTGYITLNFFNLFWIFVIASVIGLVVETLYFYIGNHWWMDRAGMLWGPFSPIYGFGACLMTIALNHFHNKPVAVIFLVSALIGGAFEFFTSWFMQYAFGVTAWNYSGTFLNIDGRTNFFYMCCWGVLGLIWVKLLLPVMLYFIKKIPWGWRYSLTAICAVLILFDGAATLTTLDCWYLREAGVPVTNQVERFCAEHYDNAYMQHRFQTMTMHVDNSARTQS